MKNLIDIIKESLYKDKLEDMSSDEFISKIIEILKSNNIDYYISTNKIAKKIAKTYGPSDELILNKTLTFSWINNAGNTSKIKISSLWNTNFENSVEIDFLCNRTELHLDPDNQIIPDFDREDENGKFISVYGCDNFLLGIIENTIKNIKL